MTDRRSISSVLFTINGDLVHWICRKQAMVGLSSNHTEMLTLLQAVKTTHVMRRLLHQLGYSQCHPTNIAEDNKPLITEVTHSRITPGIRHLDVPIAYLQEQYQRKLFLPVYTHTTNQPADINTKPHGGTGTPTNP